MSLFRHILKTFKFLTFYFYNIRAAHVGPVWLKYVAASSPIPATFIVPALIPLIEKCASIMVVTGNIDYTAHKALYDTLISDAAQSLNGKRD